MPSLRLALRFNAVKIRVIPIQKSYASAITPEGLYCTRTYFFPWSLLETKVTQNIEVRATGYATECWLWTGSVDKDGYGRVRIQSVFIKIHRLIWLCRFGMIPDDLVVCHDCDQPGCCRPEHLKLGTSPDNIKERTRKGRTARGANQGASKLTDDLVRHIRSLHPAWEYAEIGRKFGISRQHARRLVERKSWAHLS